MNDYLIENLVPLYIEFYKKNNSYKIVGGAVCNYLLNILYLDLIKEGHTKPLEALNTEQKNNYWNIALQLKQSKKERILCCKAMYALDVLTE